MRQVKINAVSQALLIALLLEGTRDCRELAEETGLHYVTVVQYTRELYRAGAAFIKRWNLDDRGRPMVKVYQVGKGRDAVKPTKTSAQVKADYRARKVAQAAHLQWGDV